MKHLKSFNESNSPDIEKLKQFQEVFEILGYQVSFKGHYFITKSEKDKFHCYCEDDYTGNYVIIETFINGTESFNMEMGNIDDLLKYIATHSKEPGMFVSQMWLKLIKHDPKFTFDCPTELLQKIDSKFKNVAKIGVFESAIEPYKKTFDCGDVVKATRFVKKIMYLAEQRDHHPSIFVNRFVVTVEVITHSENRVTDKDLDLMQDIEKIYNNL